MFNWLRFPSRLCYNNNRLGCIWRHRSNHHSCTNSLPCAPYRCTWKYNYHHQFRISSKLYRLSVGDICFRKPNHLWQQQRISNCNGNNRNGSIYLFMEFKSCADHTNSHKPCSRNLHRYSNQSGRILLANSNSYYYPIKRNYSFHFINTSQLRKQRWFS